MPHARPVSFPLSGGVGLAAVAVATRAGACVLSTAGSSRKRALLRAAGVARVSSTRTTEFATALASAGGCHPTTVLNSLTSAGFLAATLGCLGAGARVAEISKRDIWSRQRVAQERADVSLSLIALDFMLGGAQAPAQALLAALAAAMARGEVPRTQTSEYALSATTSALRLMAGAQQVGKVVVRRRLPRLLPAGPVVITGGTGSLGDLFARWAVEAGGAERLALLSRGASLPPRAALAASAASITVSRCDLSSASEAAWALSAATLGGGGAPGALLHTSGVLRDATVARQNAQSVREVFAPKVSAAVVREAAHGLGWGLVVLFSSISGFLGNGGQANCARPLASLGSFRQSSDCLQTTQPVFSVFSVSADCAANAALDFLATSGSKRGVATRSVQWGAWMVGMAANSKTVAARNVRLGIGALSPQLGLSAFAGLLSSAASPARGLSAALHPAAATLVNDFAWPAHLALYGPGQSSAPAVFSEQTAEVEAERAASAAAAATMSASSPGIALQQQRCQGISGRAGAAASAAAGAGYREGLLAKVADVAKSILGSAPDADAPLMEAGLDSLSAVELRRELERATGLALPATLVFDYPTASALADHLAKVGALEAAAAAAGAGADGEGGDVVAHTAAAAAAVESRTLVGADAAVLAERRSGGMVVVASAGFVGMAALGSSGALAGAVDSVGSVPYQRWDRELRRSDGTPSQGSFGAFLDAPDAFDAAVFAIGGTEAASMDPQQRLLLEAAFECFASASATGAAAGAQIAAAGPESLSVFVGVATSDYARLVGPSAPYAATGRFLSVTAGRISCTLSLHRSLRALQCVRCHFISGV